MCGKGWSRARLWAAFAVVVTGCGLTNQPHGQGSGGSSDNAGSGMAGKTTQGSSAGSGGEAVSSGGEATNAGAGASSAGVGADAGASGSGGGGGQAPSGGAGGSAGAAPTAIQAVKPSPGCGQEPKQALAEFVKYTIQTAGVKDANCSAKLGGQPKCGPWSIPRDYYVWLPPAYAKTHAYPLVVEGPGCGGIGTDVYSLSPTNTDADAGVDGTVIRVGLTPPPNSIGHGTNENQGCFDDKEGDDSVDFVFFEKLLDTLKAELCYDENRVFVAGTSSGSWLANELVVKYAGNTNGYAVRGVIVNTGGLPTEPQYAPTASGKPYAGIWVSEVDNTGAGSWYWTIPVSKAMQAAGCEANSYDSAQTEPFPLGGGALATSCQRIVGCPTLFPLIVCPLSGNAHGPHDEVFNPGAAAFINMLAAP